MTTVLPPPLGSPADTEHTFSRGGRELPLQVHEIGGVTDHGHLLIFGRPADNCLVRIHSRCLYGESLRSDDCDCGPELDKTLDMIQDAGAGVLIYLEQEGRGLGLLAKARGYRHSEQSGTDTFTSYEALGYPADARTYTGAAQSLYKLLVTLGIGRIQLLTNNPAKAAAVIDTGLTVTVVPLRTTALSERASDYLDAKRRHRHHWIPTDDAPWAPDLS
ncbi:GTP cyclohydrolase II [Nocardia coffeae]|uniref:GTP cyclohydrolase II n=1 Tax=Nocardia coffeae TaxID=2873381 RepID=UPI001F27EA38|nr:GTP cyclohydrolase II [Nocardia coffeae]